MTELGKVFMDVKVTRNVINHTPTVMVSGAKLDEVVPEFAAMVAEMVYPICVAVSAESVVYP